MGDGMTLKPLYEQVIVVFGASSGIGRITALEACRRGACVVAAARGEEALDTLAAEAGAPDRFAIEIADAADADQVRAVADAAVTRFGRLDTWAHVAGVAEHARFEDMPLEDFRRVIEVDLLGPVYAAKAALPHLRRAGGGAFVVVSSMIAKRSFPLVSSYSAAKHGVNGFLESLRVELQHDQVPVSVTEIQPAAIDTPFFEHARTRLGVRPSGPPPIYPPEKVAEAILRSAEIPRREVVVGGAAKAQLLLQRISPRAVDALTRLVAFRLQESNEPKGPDDPDALDRPVEGDDRLRGVVSNLRR
jgi:NAD(P)-dependent dehydrogenase (short-subunit alcohol dehydrogenase family)